MNQTARRKSNKKLFCLPAAHPRNHIFIYRIIESLRLKRPVISSSPTPIHHQYYPLTMLLSAMSTCFLNIPGMVTPPPPYSKRGKRSSPKKMNVKSISRIEKRELFKKK